MGLLNSIFGTVVGLTQLGKAGQIHPQWDGYQTSQYAQNNLANAQNAYNGRMAGASTEEQNILANQANQMGNVNRTATDGSQALAVAAGVQGQTNQAFHNLQTQEAQNKYQMLNNLNLANQGLVQEGDKTYQSNLQKYMMDTQAQAALRSSGLTNISNGIGSLDPTSLVMGSGGGGGKSGGLLSFLL
jgi:hypothetical protein